MSRLSQSLGMILALVTALAGAQSVSKDAKDAKDPKSQLAAAQAAASRPGDEALNCEALQKELVTNVNDPAVQSYIAKGGAQSKEDAARMQAAKPVVAAQMAITAFSSISPGAGYATVAAAQAQAPAQRAQAAQRVQMRMQQMNEMLSIMPQLMRGQRVLELATTKKCEWMEAAKASTGHEAGH